MSAPTASAVDIDETSGDRSLSQTLKAQILLRKLLLSGEISPGERVSEPQMVVRLGVSRTPVRMALVRLEEEGLLEAIPSGGFAVKAFDEREMFEAIEIRGTLEGLAARFAAERGVSLLELDRASAVLDQLDEVLRAGDGVDLSRYVELNARFHDMLTDFSDSEALTRQIQRANALPFASPSALVLVQKGGADAPPILLVAQDQHRCVLTAIRRREGARAEAIMREHARIAHRNLEYALANQPIMELIPGAALIRRRPGR
ncbi:GntR family transcriptional regulator [Terrarubrum flagellatum]|uniref:GntR family transcriptional regulator n=1 Tax=Terrirubrum flagellatum TaxID=2895980 RepID=UPI003145196A